MPNDVSDLFNYLETSPSPLHAAETASARLGAEDLSLSEAWNLLPRKIYSVAREGAARVFFRLPETKTVSGFRIIAAHLDSPGLKLKPRPKRAEAGLMRWGIDIYGGPILHTWFDRDLSLAGRIALGNTSRLFDFQEFSVRIPHVAIHLDRDVNENGPKINAEKHLIPIIGEGPECNGRLLQMFSSVLGREVTDWASLHLDAFLYDRAKPELGGINKEFIYSGKLDNLSMCHASVRALQSASVGSAVQCIALFDHEEIGSESAEGAASDLLTGILERISIASGHGREEWLRARAASFLISADMAHGFHPNYPERYDSEFYPVLNGGPVIKKNASLRYITDAPAAGRFAALCQSLAIPCQTYVHRADMRCGTTIGPVLASQIGCPGVDVGLAMLSMHSIREMAGAKDHSNMVRVLKEFLEAEKV